MTQMDDNRERMEAVMDGDSRISSFLLQAQCRRIVL